MSVPPSSPETGLPVVAVLQLMAEWQCIAVWYCGTVVHTLDTIQSSLERQHCHILHQQSEVNHSAVLRSALDTIAVSFQIKTFSPVVSVSLSG